MSTGTVEKVRKVGNTVEVIAGRGYLSHVKRKPLAIVKDTGNGLIARFPSYISCEQEHYVCMDYSQAHALYLALAKRFEVAA